MGLVVVVSAVLAESVDMDSGEVTVTSSLIFSTKSSGLIREGEGEIEEEEEEVVAESTGDEGEEVGVKTLRFCCSVIIEQTSTGGQKTSLPKAHSRTSKERARQELRSIELED